MTAPSRRPCTMQALLQVACDHRHLAHTAYMHARQHSTHQVRPSCQQGVVVVGTAVDRGELALARRGAQEPLHHRWCCAELVGLIIAALCAAYWGHGG